ncbi:PREDICTED: patatin-like protein 8 [Tarenaya hassleriana]|uniref:patatin-like protein 8 n=1 Tax=Tarenaya hassleriana TaxID=28532 RepID=UPI00053C5B41|nr:PREDICTED: patatin-like protein 8 [Tarenaya hassleriana]
MSKSPAIRRKQPPDISSSKGKNLAVSHSPSGTGRGYPRTPPSPAAAAAAIKPHEPSIDPDKLSYEIFSILENKFLFGYEDPRQWIPRSPRPISESEPGPSPRSPLTPTAVAAVSASSSSSLSFKSSRGRICILSIDGGGMRGILAGKSLAYLEQALKQKSGDPNARIADYFDVAAGSGIGSTVAAMLFATRDGNRPIFKADDTWRFLVDNAKGFYRPGGGGAAGVLKRVMKPGSGCSSSSAATAAATVRLEKIMKEAFADLTLKDTLKPLLIPCYDLITTAPFLFSRADSLESDSYDFTLREICRATWAEPGTFDPVRMSSVDGKTRCVAVEGGLAMSNPTAAAITHVVHNKLEFPYAKNVEDLLVLSLGTGQLFEVNYDYEQVKNWKAKEWVRPMARISGDGSAEFVDQAVAMGFGPFRSSNYVRIQQASGSRLGACGPNVDTDPSSENVKMLTEIADEMLKQKNVESVLFGSKRIGEMSNSEKLEWFAGELVREHQSRSCRASPTVTLRQSIPRTTRNAVNATLSLISRER